jgi:hypothetical protein
LLWHSVASALPSLWFLGTSSGTDIGGISAIKRSAVCVFQVTACV